MDELKKLLENAGMDEAVSDWTPQASQDLSVEDDSGDMYTLSFEDRKEGETMFLDANGVTVAMAQVGGAGFQGGKIKDPNAVLDALYAFANQGRR